MEELIKALTPFPLVQGIAIGLLVAGMGAWALKRGLQDRRDFSSDTVLTVRIERTVEEHIAQQQAYETLGHIRMQHDRVVDVLSKLVDATNNMHSALNRVLDNQFNRRQ